MLGEYVRWNGQLSKIIYEVHGYVTIKVLKTQQEHDVFMSMLQPVKLQVVKKREEEKESSLKWG